MTFVAELEIEPPGRPVTGPAADDPRAMKPSGTRPPYHREPGNDPRAMEHPLLPGRWLAEEPRHRRRAIPRARSRGPGEQQRRRDGRTRRAPRAPRRPLPGLLGLVVLALVAAFFGWYSAPPLWLSLGHGVRGMATVATCDDHGMARRCADFTAAGGTVLASGVSLLGGGDPAVGTAVPARMASPGSWAAYPDTGDRTDLYLRWIPGLALVLLCGVGIAWVTGARKLPRRRSRHLAVLASLGGPVLVAAGMLAAAW